MRRNNARDEGNIADMLQINGRIELWKALISTTVLLRFTVNFSNTKQIALYRCVRVKRGQKVCG